MVYVGKANIEPLRQSKLDLKLSIVYDLFNYGLRTCSNTMEKSLQPKQFHIIFYQS